VRNVERRNGYTIGGCVKDDSGILGSVMESQDGKGGTTLILFLRADECKSLKRFESKEKRSRVVSEIAYFDFDNKWRPLASAPGC